MEPDEPESQQALQAGRSGPAAQPGGFFDGPWLRRAGILVLAVGVLGVIAWLLWVKVAAPWLQVNALEAKGIKVPPGEDRELTGLLGEAFSIFDDGNYKEARQRFLALEKRVRADDLRTIVEGYVTATYTGAGEHREGLNYLCRISAGRPLQDVRHRYRFQAHLRAISDQEGKEAAKSLVANLRSTCPRREVSYVWAGIRREKAEYLAKGFTLYDEFYQLSPEDRKYLQDVLRDYPRDAFADHALYFLRKFDQIIKDYPQSLILDVVYRAAAQQAFAAKDYDRAIVYLKGYLDIGAKRWPSMPHVSQVKLLLARSHARRGELKIAIDWLLQLGPGMGTELAGLLGQEGPFSDAEEVRAFLGTLTHYYTPEQLGEMFDRNCKDQFDLATEALTILDYNWALAEYQEVHEVFKHYRMGKHVPWCVDRGIDVLERFNDYGDETNEGLLKLGIDLRNAAEELGNPAFEMAAATVWEDCAGRFPDTEEAPKALYLAGAALRRLGDYSEARDLFKKLAENYHASELADDARTEVGWYYMHVESDYSLARTYFESVAGASSGNARDNALYWLARTYYNEEDYSRALDIYRDLVKRFPYGRLTRDYARQEIKRLEPVVASKTDRRVLRGVVSLATCSQPPGLRVIEVDRNERWKENGLRRNDVITAVDGQAVDSDGLLENALGRVKPGDEVTLTVIRGEAELSIAGTVKEYSYYKDFPGISIGAFGIPLTYP